MCEWILWSYGLFMIILNYYIFSMARIVSLSIHKLSACISMQQTPFIVISHVNVIIMLILQSSLVIVILVLFLQHLYQGHGCEAHRSVQITQSRSDRICIIYPTLTIIRLCCQFQPTQNKCSQDFIMFYYVFKQQIQTKFSETTQVTQVVCRNQVRVGQNV